MTDIVVDPLRRFQLFRTSGSKELRHFVSALFGAAGIDLKNTTNFDVRVNRFKQRETGLASRCSAKAWRRSAKAGLSRTTCRFLNEYPNWVGPLLRT